MVPLDHASCKCNAPESPNLEAAFHSVKLIITFILLTKSYQVLVDQCTFDSGTPSVQVGPEIPENV